MDQRAKPIVVEQYFDQPIDRVWNAITERDQMIQWFFDNIPEFRAETGFKTSFDVDSGNRIFRHNWRILEAEAKKRIVYHWSYEDLPGVGKVVFELIEKAGGTLLRLTNTGLDTFPDSLPEFSRESCVAGWEYFIQGNLKKYLDGS